MRQFQCLLFVLKRSCICCYIICMTIPLNNLCSLSYVIPQQLQQGIIKLKYTHISPVFCVVLFQNKLRSLSPEYFLYLHGAVPQPFQDNSLHGSQLIPKLLHETQFPKLPCIPDLKILKVLLMTVICNHVKRCGNCDKASSNRKAICIYCYV